MSATVSANYEKTISSKFSGDFEDNTPGRFKSTGTTVNITNNYPQAQSDSKTRDDVADGIRLASSI